MEGNTGSEIDALDLLTEDCWKEILKRVKAPEDLKSCSETCLIFEEILRKKKKEFMFSLILPHILGYLSESYLDEWTPWLKCRLVCKSWRKSIDKLQEAEDGFVRGPYYFDTGEGIEQFLQKFERHDGNPFLGRSMAFRHVGPLLLAGNQEEDLNADTFDLRMQQLLERFGHEIWKLEMYEPCVFEHITFSKNIQRILGHLPNLRNLALRSAYFGGPNIDLEQQIEQADLATYIAANPIPPLPKLEKLDADGLNVVMTRSILEKAPQLKSAAVGDPSGYPEQISQLSNLETLVLDQVDATTSLHFLGQLRSPLQSLCLDVVNDSDMEVWAIDELFRNIQHLPIQDLSITVYRVFLGESGAISAEDRPYHGSISSVYLRFPSGSASLNFLLNCPKLKFVQIDRFEPRDGIPAGHPNGVAESLDVNDLVDQVGYDFYQSSIWENIASLKSFTLRNFLSDDFDWERNDFERGEYEKRKLERGREIVGE